MSEIIKFEEHESRLQKLIDSKQLPAHIKTVEAAYMVASQGAELGFPTIASFNYLIPIQGKITLSAKAISALLRRADITFQTLEDAVWVYPDESTKSYNDGKAIDRRTTIAFQRGGIEEKVSYTLQDAMAAGYMKKDNWERMFKEMCWARCISKGANRIAADVLMGLYSTDELHDALDKGQTKVKRDEDGTILEVEYTDA